MGDAPASTTSRLIDLHLTAVLTNTAPTGAYRGAGRPEAIYIIERLMDAAAREMELDPAELRRRNMIRPEQMPYTNAMAQIYDSGQFEQILDQGLALADWNGFEARRAASQARGKLRGRGIATFLEWTGGNALSEERDGRRHGRRLHRADRRRRMAMGQGIATSYAQLAVDVFGVPLERIRVLQGDTDRANGFGSAGSRSLFTGGAAVHVASRAHASSTRRSWPPRRWKRRPPTSNTAPAASASPAPTSASTCSSWPASSPRRASSSTATATAGGAELAERLPRLRGRDRPRHRRGARSWPTRRSTTSAASSARPSCAARSKAARCRASARRCASAWSTTATAASC